MTTDDEILKRSLSEEGEMYLRICCIPQDQQSEEQQEKNRVYLFKQGLMAFMLKEMREHPPLPPLSELLRLARKPVWPYGLKPICKAPRQHEIVEVMQAWKRYEDAFWLRIRKRFITTYISE